MSAQQHLPLHGGKRVSPSAAWMLALRLQCCSVGPLMALALLAVLVFDFDALFLHFLIIADILAPHLSPAFHWRIVFLFSF